ncbi:hypothetical protein QL285_027053 [Trifolium repens]|nr:hypothetical protein QL285_027053 [Trifolium repens]
MLFSFHRLIRNRRRLVHLQSSSSKKRRRKKEKKGCARGFTFHEALTRFNFEDRIIEDLKLLLNQCVIFL